MTDIHKGPGAAPDPEILGNRCGNEDCHSYSIYPHCNHEDCTAVWCMRCLWERGECDRSHPQYPDRLREDAKAEIRQLKPVLEVGKVDKRYTVQANGVYGYKNFPEGWVFDLTSDAPAWHADELAAMLEVVEHIKALPGPDTW